MKLDPNFVTYSAKGEHYLVPTGAAKFKGIVKNNETAAFIVERLKTETTEQALVGSVLEKYPAANGKDVERDVADILEKLRSIGALNE